MTMLDCTDRDSALVTASAVLGIPAAELTRACMRVSPDDRSTGDLLRVLGRASFPDAFQSAYFHGSRAVDPEAFRREGILPLGGALPRIWEMLAALARDVCDVPGWARFRRGLEEGSTEGWAADLYHLKAADAFHWGPYGFLVRDAALCPAGSPWHNYLRGPEIIEDICRTFEAVHGVDLLARFLQASRPCLVKFIGPGNDRTLDSALEYLVCVLHGNELNMDVGHCFNGEGAAIPPERIVAVEIIDRLIHLTLAPPAPEGIAGQAGREPAVRELP